MLLCFLRKKGNFSKGKLAIRQGSRYNMCIKRSLGANLRERGVAEWNNPRM